MELPKHTRKHIYWGNQHYGRAYILVGYCPDTLAYFQLLFDEARKTFPALEAKDVTCSKVTQSEYVKGFTFITFEVSEKKEYKGWQSYEGFADFHY